MGEVCERYNIHNLFVKVKTFTKLFLVGWVMFLSGTEIIEICNVDCLTMDKLKISLIFGLEWCL